MANKTIHQNKNEVKAIDIKILKLEKPKTLRDNKSLLFLKLSKNHILEIKTINGRSLIIIFGIKRAVNVIGKRIELLKFLKNSISSNKFKISPKQ